MNVGTLANTAVLPTKYDLRIPIRGFDKSYIKRARKEIEAERIPIASLDIMRLHYYARLMNQDETSGERRTAEQRWDAVIKRTGFPDYLIKGMRLPDLEID